MAKATAGAGALDARAHSRATLAVTCGSSWPTVTLRGALSETCGSEGWGPRTVVAGTGARGLGQRGSLAARRRLRRRRRRARGRARVRLELRHRDLAEVHGQPGGRVDRVLEQLLRLAWRRVSPARARAEGGAPSWRRARRTSSTTWRTLGACGAPSARTLMNSRSSSYGLCQRPPVRTHTPRRTRRRSAQNCAQSPTAPSAATETSLTASRRSACSSATRSTPVFGAGLGGTAGAGAGFAELAREGVGVCRSSLASRKERSAVRTTSSRPLRS
jgi:hypothetical protein